MSETSKKEWIELGNKADVPEDHGLFVEAEGKELAVFCDEGRYFCLEDACPHESASLSEGRILNGEVVCPWHGWRYKLEDGSCSSLPSSMPAEQFPIRVDEDGKIFVKLSD